MLLLTVGPTWCTAFRKRQDADFKYTSQSDMAKKMKKIWDINTWHETNKTYVNNLNAKQLIPALNSIFVVETQRYTLDQEIDEGRRPRSIIFVVRIANINAEIIQSKTR